MPVSTTYSIVAKKENAHSDSIYCCSWVTACDQGDTRNAKNYIATGGLDGMIKVWTFENDQLQLLNTMNSHNGMAIVSIAISPNAETIASTSMDSTLIIWDLITGKVYNQVETIKDAWLVAYSPDSKYIATGGHTGKILIYSVDARETDRVLDTRGKFALCVAWSSDGRLIASGAEDGAVYIMDVEQGKVLHSVPPHGETARGVAFSSNSSLLVASGGDYVYTYHVASGDLRHKMDMKTWALGVCFSADGLCIAVGLGDGSVRLLQTDGLTTLHTFKEHTDMAWGVNYNAAGSKLLSVSKDKAMVIYECPPAKANKKQIK